MKLLFYCDTVFSFGGVQRVLAEISKAFSMSGKYEVTILTTDTSVDLSMYDYRRSKVKFKFLQYENVFWGERYFCKIYSFFYKKILPHSKFTSILYGKSSFLPSFRESLIDKVNEDNYTWVIGVHVFASLHLSIISGSIKASTIGWIHNSYHALFEKKNPYLKDMKNFFEVEMRRLDRLVVLSHVDSNLFMRKMGLQTNVIYNPLTVQPYSRGGEKNKRFLSVGRFSYQHKGFDILIKAFALFASSHLEWVLDIVGEGPEEVLYRSLISDYQLENRVILHPFTKDIMKYYTNASIYVMSSRWEGFGLVLIEAMAHGLPVISSNVPVALELLENKGVAVFFENENVEHLAKSMSYMVDTANLEEMGENAYEYSKAFEISSICHEWDSLLLRKKKGI